MLGLECICTRHADKLGRTCPPSSAVARGTLGPGGVPALRRCAVHDDRRRRGRARKRAEPRYRSQVAARGRGNADGRSPERARAASTAPRPRATPSRRLSAWLAPGYGKPGVAPMARCASVGRARRPCAGGNLRRMKARQQSCSSVCWTRALWTASRSCGTALSGRGDGTAKDSSATVLWRTGTFLLRYRA